VSTDERTRETPGLGFWIGLALGTPLMLYGAVELIDQTGWSRAFAAGRWLAGGLLLHDFVLVPVVLALVWALGRWTPAWLGTPLRAGVLASLLVLALGLPGLRGYSQRPDNPTVHPLDYGTAVLSVLATVWGVVAVWALWRLATRARASRGPAPSGDDPGSPRTSRTPAPG
jgi:hypothetical protein